MGYLRFGHQPGLYKMLVSFSLSFFAQLQLFCHVPKGDGGNLKGLERSQETYILEKASPSFKYFGLRVFFAHLGQVKRELV